MHPECQQYLRRFFTLDNLDVIEIGSRDINGSARAFFPNATWTGLDLYPGPGVDVVCDALEYQPSDSVDFVICCEVLEHASKWRDIIQHASNWLKPRGRIIITCAGPGRDPHSASDGGKLLAGEYYANINQDELAEELHYSGFEQIEVSGNEQSKDTYAIAWKSLQNPAVIV